MCISSRHQILYPYVVKPDLMVLMSQSVRKVRQRHQAGGTLIVEQDLVRVQELNVPDVRVFAIPQPALPKTSQAHGENVVMTGFFGAISDCFSATRLAARSRIQCRSVCGTQCKAFDAGYEYGLKHLETGAMELERRPVSVPSSSQQSSNRQAPLPGLRMYSPPTCQVVELTRRVWHNCQDAIDTPF